MASPFSLEHLARIREGARRLSDCAVELESHSQDLLAAAESNLDDARAALLADNATTSPDARSRAIYAHLARNTAHVDAMREMCVSARQNHNAVAGLLVDLDPPDEPSTRPRQAVLVVDDYQDSREWLSMVLKDAGFVVHTASNGLEALICAYERRPVVIVMDVMMPVLDGIEAARLIKAIDTLNETRVIAYTALAPQPVVSEIFTAVLRKPSPPDVVIETVKHWAAAG